jgi:hypothetical protein
MVAAPIHQLAEAGVQLGCKAAVEATAELEQVAAPQLGVFDLWLYHVISSLCKCPALE